MSIEVKRNNETFDYDNYFVCGMKEGESFHGGFIGGYEDFDELMSGYYIITHMLLRELQTHSNMTDKQIAYYMQSTFFDSIGNVNIDLPDFLIGTFGEVARR